MQSLDDVIRYLQEQPDCHVARATRLPTIPPELRLPAFGAVFMPSFPDAILFAGSKGADHGRPAVAVPRMIRADREPLFEVQFLDNGTGVAPPGKCPV
jgi:hypothetical protein